MPSNTIDQIVEWKERRGRPRLGIELSNEIERLRTEWHSAKDAAASLSDFIPCRIVTVLEVFIREAIRELVDSGSPYTERAEKLTKGTRIDFLFLINTHERNLSIGDIVAHSISTHSFDRILATFEELIPDFKDGLTKAHERWTDDQERWPLPPIIKDFDLMAAQLARVLWVRHIVVHELPREQPYEIDELDGFFDATLQFILATDWLIVERLKGSIPRTQMQMNVVAKSTLDERLKHLDEIVAQVANDEDVDPLLLAENQSKWAAYADSKADLRASLVKGGSMYPMLWASAKLEAVEARIHELQWWLDRKEGDL